MRIRIAVKFDGDEEEEKGWSKKTLIPVKAIVAPVQLLSKHERFTGGWEKWWRKIF